MRALLAGLFLIAAFDAAAMEVSLNVSETGPGKVGQPLIWYGASDAPEGSRVRFRFRVRSAEDGDFRVVRDYSPVSSIAWAPVEREGFYEIEVSAKDLDSGEVVSRSQLHQFASRLEDGSAAAINPTAHPLVFLFSSAPCPEGSRLHVRFTSANGDTTHTPARACTADASMNFYLAGLRPQSSYRAQAMLDSSETFGPELTFVSGAAPNLAWRQTVQRAAPAGTTNRLLLGSSGGGQIATDLEGNVLWYNPEPVSQITSAEPGGTFWGYIESDDLAVGEQVIRELDLTGMTVRETNAERANEQLIAMGKRPITTFHHDVKRLPDGRIVALAAVERLMSDVQGPGELDILGDMIVVFDNDMQVVWAWDSFDGLDVTRGAILGETCLANGACPNYHQAADANDWTHGNSVRPTPDGQLLFSARHQDWLIKISYDNAQGDGHVIWKLGQRGDFGLQSPNYWDWFSHQHDGSFDPDNPTHLIVYDNGNTRVAETGASNSRGQVYELDETNRQARLILNADLQVYSAAVGSGQKLRNGHYHFDSGFVVENGARVSYNTEVDQSGTIVYSVKANTLLYRSYRLEDMYTPR